MIRHLLRAWKVPPVLGCLSLLAAFVLPTPDDAAAPPSVWPSSLPRPSWTAPATAPSTPPPALTAPPAPQPSPTRVQAGPTVPRTTQPVPTPSPTGSTATSPSASPSETPEPTQAETPEPEPSPSESKSEPGNLESTPPNPSPSAGTTITARYTGYGYADNDCGGPGDCTAYGDGHAGGSGTWDDPVSIAVGADQLDQWPAGTVLYLVDLHRYGVVEDRCGACTGAWVDVWVDGRGSADDGVECMRSFTGDSEIVLNPPPGLQPAEFVPGVISDESGCHL